MTTYIVLDAEEEGKLRRRRTGINTDPFQIIIDPERIKLQKKTEQDWMDDKITSEEFYLLSAEKDMFFSEQGEHLILIDLKELRERYINTKDLFPNTPGLREKLIVQLDATIARKESEGGSN